MARATQNRMSNTRDLRGAGPAARSRRIADNLLEAPTIIRYASPEPFNAKLPKINELTKLNDLELSNVLSRFGVTETWPQMRASMVGYLDRMSNLPAGTPQFQQELDRLLDVESKQGLLRHARRSYRDYAMSITDTTGVLLRICEDDESSCDNCIRLGGFEGTIEQQRAVGLPGAASCDGGEFCRCGLVPS